MGVGLVSGVGGGRAGRWTSRGLHGVAWGDRYCCVFACLPHLLLVPCMVVLLTANNAQCISRPLHPSPCPGTAHSTTLSRPGYCRTVVS